MSQPFFVASLSLALAAGIAIGHFLIPNGGPTSTVSRRDEAPRNDARAALAEAIATRDALAHELAATRQELGAHDPEPAATASEPEPRPQTQSAPDTTGSQQAAESRVAEPTDATLSATKLVRLGFSDAEIARLQQHHDEFELARLDLEYEARREGWERSGRYHDEERALRDRLRNELGDTRFDAVLYATAQPNRLVVTDVIGGSEADTAGLREGDALLSYDDERIFDYTAIRSATTAGTRGESTELRYVRDGEERRTFVPRGPIGVKLRRESQPPDTLR